MKISILMPCYNSHAFLEKSISSVIRQDYKDWELICVDDYSSDDTFELLQEYAKQDKRIKIFKSEKNGGCASPALNLALKHSEGDFIFLLGHDDEISTDCLKGLVEAYYERGGGIDVIIPDTIFIRDGIKIGSICGIKYDKNSKDKILTAQEAFELSLFWDISGFALFKADIVKKYGFLVDGMNGDEYSAREFFLNANKIAFSKKGQYLYNQISDSLTKKLSPRKFNIHKVFYRLEKLALERNMDKGIIKKINKERYAQLYNLSKEYVSNKHLLSKAEQELITSYLEESKNLLKYYKISFFDNIFRKEKDGFGKFIVLFNCLKIYYKKIKYV